jgi:hypothetical protein
MRPGDKLPSEAQLMNEYTFADPMTIRNALGVLRDQGLIAETERGSGVFVRTRWPVKITWRRHVAQKFNGGSIDLDECSECGAVVYGDATDFARGKHERWHTRVTDNPSYQAPE